MDPGRLREATRAEHEATEALMPLMDQTLRLESYVRVLQTLCSLMESWETWVDSAAEGELREMLRTRRRSHLLREDLRALGTAATGERSLPKVNWDLVVAGNASDEGSRVEASRFEASLLGAVYVVEGSTLGGRFLARQVEASLSLQPGVGDAYFRGHGEATGAMWREVQERIAAIPEGLGDLTVGSAKRTFGVFGEALRAGVPAPQTMH